MPAPTLVTTVNLDTQPWAQTVNVAVVVLTKNYNATSRSSADVQVQIVSNSVAN